MQKSRNKGLTLLELMVAAAILLLVISGSLLTFLHCMFLNETGNNLVTAVNDAQYVLEQIKAIPYSDIASYTPPTFNNLSNESITLNRTIGSSISKITVNVNWQERQKPRVFSISTFIAK